MDKVHTLPTLIHRPTTAYSSRHGVKPTVLAIHRWDGGTFESVVEMFINSPHDQNGKSATFVYAGEIGPYAGKFAQQIPIAGKPWTQAGWNPHCISIECADAIFLGHDPEGFQRLARIIAGLCHYEGIRPRWISGAELIVNPNGFTRHHDLGVLGGNHPQCPTTDIRKWLTLTTLTHNEFLKGGFRDRHEWGLI